MSIDKSLKSKSRLAKVRSVLTRVERIALMKDEDKWVDGQSVMGLKKTKVPRLTLGKKKKEKKEEEPADAKGAKGKAAAKAPAAGAAAAAAPAKKK